MAVGRVDSGIAWFAPPDRINVQKPGTPVAGSGGGKEDVPCVEIGVANALAMKLVEEFADRGHDPRPLAGQGPGGEKIIQIAAAGNEGGGYFHPAKRAGRIKEGRLDLRGGNA
jgi:hypothetical protein